MDSVMWWWNDVNCKEFSDETLFAVQQENVNEYSGLDVTV